MSNNNEKEILYSYLRECNTVMVYSNGDISNKLNCIIDNVIQYERPDMYSILNDEVIMIEHFEFDSYKSNKKGSDYKWKEGNIKNKFNKLIENRNKDEIIYNDTIKVTATKDNYINNFMIFFEDHYKKIDIYKKRISLKSNNKIKTYFFIEDISPLGSYYFTSKREFKNLKIFQFKEIIKFLLDHKEVSAILYGYFDGNKKKLLLLENNKYSIDGFIQEHELADELECYWFEPNISGFSYPIIKIEE